MSNIIQEVYEIEQKYEKLLDACEATIGYPKIFDLFKNFNSLFVEASHGREWRNFRKNYRADFPDLNKSGIELITLFDVYYSAFISECLNSFRKIALGQDVLVMKAEVLHIQAWDIALCSINKKAKGGLDDYVSNLENQFYTLLGKYNLSKIEIIKYLSAILTILPTPLISYEDTLKKEYKEFFDEYGYNSTNFKLIDIEFSKYKYILRASLYNEELFNSQIKLIAETNGNYFNCLSLENRHATRKNKLDEIAKLITNKKDFELFNSLLEEHDALTYLNVNIESQFGFKSILGLIGIYIIKKNQI